MSAQSLARPAHCFTLYLVHSDGSEELVSKHTAFESGWKAGTHAVTVLDRQGAYSLYLGERRVARFSHNRLAPRHGAAILRASGEMMGGAAVIVPPGNQLRRHS